LVIHQPIEKTNKNKKQKTKQNKQTTTYNQQLQTAKLQNNNKDNKSDTFLRSVVPSPTSSLSVSHVLALCDRAEEAKG
jgi:hypothetical protein